MEAAMSYQCPVCNRVSSSTHDLVRHMLGRGDRDHREWITSKGFSYSKMVVEQAMSFGGEEYKRFADALEEECGMKV